MQSRWRMSDAYGDLLRERRHSPRTSFRSKQHRQYRLETARCRRHGFRYVCLFKTQKGLGSAMCIVQCSGSHCIVFLIISIMALTENIISLSMFILCIRLGVQMVNPIHVSLEISPV